MTARNSLRGNHLTNRRIHIILIMFAKLRKIGMLGQSSQRRVIRLILCSHERTGALLGAKILGIHPA